MATEASASCRNWGRLSLVLGLTGTALVAYGCGTSSGKGSGFVVTDAAPPIDAADANTIDTGIFTDAAPALDANAPATDSGSGVIATCATNADCASGNVCLNSACIPGICTTSLDCATADGGAAGQLCTQIGTDGGSFAACIACTSDTQCQSDSYYSTQTMNFCVSGLCTTAPSCPAATTPPPMCGGGITSDICCNGACVPGSAAPTGSTAARCCTDTDCTVAGYHCAGYICSQCPVATPTGTGAYTLYVDPANAQAGGSGATAGACGFQTITAALKFLKTKTPITGSVINLVSTSAGETFPLLVPAGVTIRGTNSTGGAPTTIPSVTAPANATVFSIAAGTSTLSTLAISTQVGAASAASVGVKVSSLGVGILDHLTISGMLTYGIYVNGNAGVGTTQLNNGIVVQNSGVGLAVLGTGVATVTGGQAVADQTLFTGNTYGMEVNSQASLTINGVVNSSATPITGTVTVQNSKNANVYITQNPTLTLTQNVITGLTASGSLNGRNIQITGGSKLKLRSSSLLGTANLASGSVGGAVVLVQYGSGTTLNTDYSGIDLGTDTATNAGVNLLQTFSGDTRGPQNTVGLCFYNGVPTATTSMPHAEGNQWVDITGSKADCTTQTSTLYGRKNCQGILNSAISIGGVTATTGLDVLGCTVQITN